MVDETIFKLLALPMTLATNDKYIDYFMFEDKKLMGYSVSLVMEIDELLDKGYIKEEISDLITQCDFVANDPTLTKEEAEYLRNYSLRMLDVRYRLYTDEKDKKDCSNGTSLKKHKQKNT